MSPGKAARSWTPAGPAAAQPPGLLEARVDGRRARRRHDGVGHGIASSVSIPVGRPSASRTIVPPLGALVARVMFAARSAAS